MFIRKSPHRHPGKGRDPGCKHFFKTKLTTWIPAFAGITRSFFFLFFSSIYFSATFASAKIYMNQEEALALAFPGASQVERKSLFLTMEQIKKIETLAKSKLKSEYKAYYVGRSSSGIMGYAFFDSHLVRTMPETLMVVLNTNGSIRFIEILAFHEPDDYQPRKKWLDLYKNKNRSKSLWIKRSIRNITGATLSTHAINDAVRRILSIFEVTLNPISD